MSLPPDAFDVVDAVHEHWVLQGIRDAGEMRDELADHLDAALRDGKSIEDVTGTDLKAFADEWAAEHPRDSRLWTWGAIAGGAAFTASIGVAAQVIRTRSLDVRIGLTESLVAGAILAMAVLLFRGRLTSTSRPRSRRRTWLRDTALLTVATVGLSAIIRRAHRPDIHLAPWLTVVLLAPLAVLAVACFALDLPSIRQLLGLRDHEYYRAEIRRRVDQNEEFERRWKPEPE